MRRHHLANRVFTLGIGSAADRHLVKGLARAGRGTAAFTQHSENISAKVIIVMVRISTDSIPRQVVRQLKEALQPCVHDVQVDWGGAGG